MTLGSIYFSGLASGLDTDNIIEKLMSLERRPQTLVKEKSEDQTTRASVVNAAKSKLASLLTQVRTFTSATTSWSRAQSVVTSSDMVATASSSGTPAPEGNYFIEVTQTATAALVTSQAALYTGGNSTAQAAVLSSGASMNAAGFTIDPALPLADQSAAWATGPEAGGTLVVNGKNIAWTSSMSIHQIVAAINNSGSGATAGYDPATQRFSLRSNAVGASAALSVSETSGNFWSVAQIVPGTVAGADASLPSLSAPVGAVEAFLDHPVTSGTFTINNVIFSVDASTDNLQTLIARINQSGAGVTAAYNSAAKTVALYQKSTGSSQGIVLGAAGDTSNFLYALKLSANNPPDGTGADAHYGTDALVSLNGAPARSFADNSIDALVPNVTINVRGTGSTTLAIGADLDAMVAQFRGLVDAYNGVMEYLNDKLSETRIEDPETSGERVEGSFVGHPLLRNTKSEMTSIMTAAIASLPGEWNQLAQLGLSTTSADFGKSGEVELDENRLRSALSGHREEAEEILNRSGEGILTRLEKKLASLTDGVFGAYSVEQKEWSDSAADLNKRVEEMETRLKKREEALRLQFAALESLMSSMQSQSSRLSSLLSQSSSSQE